VESNDISYSEMGYIGDDLNDYDAMEVCGFRACPKNACEEIRELVDYVSDVRGGEGAVRDIAEYLLKARKQWDKAIRNVYGCKSIKVKDK
jgi:3-deoxy-D-manno-octulosonate 8-phosphate phosphatase (KDO 8-P phosphatase)